MRNDISCLKCLILDGVQDIFLIKNSTVCFKGGYIAKCSNQSIQDQTPLLELIFHAEFNGDIHFYQPCHFGSVNSTVRFMGGYIAKCLNKSIEDQTPLFALIFHAEFIGANNFYQTCNFGNINSTVCFMGGYIAECSNQ